MDELPQIEVSGAPEGRPIELELSVTDAAGHEWRSRGADAARLFWDMEFASEDVAPTTFVAPSTALDYHLLARSGGATAESALTRSWSGPGVQRSELSGEGFAGALFTPAGGEGRGVLLVPGSTGLSAMEPMAALLASHGYLALVAAYMQEPGLPPAMNEIPVEVVGAALEQLEAVAGPSAVVGASVGTQGLLSALALGSAAATRAVAIAPSSVVWQALPDNGRPPQTAAWSHGGEPLPWLAMHGERILPEMVKHSLLERLSRHPRPHALHMMPAYAPSLRITDKVEKAAIEVEKIGCPLLVLSGEDDQMWPATRMAEMIAQRRKGAGVDSGDRYLAFPGAGHFLRPPITPTTVPWNDALVSGGGPEASARAQADGWSAILAFLGSG